MPVQWLREIREDVHVVSICTVLENCYCISHNNIFWFYDVLQIICCNMFVCCWGLDLSTCILHALHYSISQGLLCIFQIASNSGYQLTCWLHLVSNLYEYISRIPFMLSLVFRWMLPTSTSNIMLINLDILNQTLILNLVRWSTYLM